MNFSFQTDKIYNLAEEKYERIKNISIFFVLDKNYELNLSRQLETAVARRSGIGW